MEQKQLTSLCQGFSYLQEHKFRHFFQDTLNPLCDCGHDIETTIRFFFHYRNFYTHRQTLLNHNRNINEQTLSQDKVQ